MADNNAPPPGIDELIAEYESKPPVDQSQVTASGESTSNTEPAGIDELIAPQIRAEAHGSLASQLGTALEGAASAATFGLSTGLEKNIGKIINRENPPEFLTAEAIRARREENPLSHMAGQAVGLIATPVGETLGAAGKAGSKLLGLGAEAAAKEAAEAGLQKALAAGAEKAAANISSRAAEKAALEGFSTTAKIGSKAATGAVENALFQSGDEISKMLAEDPAYANPGAAAQTALTNIGLAAVIGGGVSGAFGSVPPLWEATVGPKVNRVLKRIADHTGGIEGAVANPVDELVAKTGMELSPEIKAGLSNDPFIAEQFRTLQQSDTTKSGLALQQSYQKFKDDVSNHLIETLGRTPEDITGDLSKYELGKGVGRTLADEFDAQVSPLAKTYDELYDKFKNVELSPSISNKSKELALSEAKALEKYNRLQVKMAEAEASLSPSKIAQAQQNLLEASDNLSSIQRSRQTPGTTDALSEKIGQLAANEGWAISPSSDIMKEVTRIQRELPNLKNLTDLRNYIKAVGDNMQADPMNGPLLRAGGMIKQILRDEESQIIGRRLGATEGAESLERYAAVRKAYHDQSQLREALDSRLHAKGSTAGYGKSLREMAQTDGEAVLNRLSGKNDADLLKLLQENFPKTSAAIQRAHIDQLLHTAVNSAKPGEVLSAAKLLKSVNSMSPELRNFAIPGATQAKLEAVGTMLEQLNKRPYNFSNTARTMDKLMQYIPGSVVGLASMLGGQSILGSLGIGALTKALSKDVPDAARLALLKFVGSGQKIDAVGFKSALEFIKSTIKGEQLIARGIKNMFKAGQEVLPQTFMVKDSEKRKLDKAVQAHQSNPLAIETVGGKTGHYLPSQGQALAQTSANAVNYLNSIRPQETRNSPLDTPIKPRPDQIANYDLALTIAQQPLSVLPSIKDGSITPQAIVHLKTLYPALYTRLSQKLMDEVNNAATKGILIPYKTKMGISLFTMQALDSTMQPMSIQAAQSINGAPMTSEEQSQNQQQNQLNKPMRANTKISKIPSQHMTQDQSAEAEHQRIDR